MKPVRIAVCAAALSLLSLPLCGQSQVGDQVPLAGLDGQAKMQKMMQGMFTARPQGFAAELMKARLAVLAGFMTAEMTLKFGGGDPATASVPFPESEKHDKQPLKLEDALLVPVRSVLAKSFDRRSYDEALKKSGELLENAFESGAVGKDEPLVQQFGAHVARIRSLLRDKVAAQKAVLAYRSWLMDGLLRPATKAELEGLTALSESVGGVGVEDAASSGAATSGAGPKPAAEPEGYRELLAPGTSPSWDASPEGQKQLNDRQNYQLVDRQDPFLAGRLQTVQVYRTHVEGLPRQSEALLAQLEQLRSKVRDAREFGMTEDMPALEKQIREVEQKLADLWSVESLIATFRNHRGNWRGARRNGQVPYAMFGGLLADVRQQPRAELLEQLQQTQGVIVALLQDGFRDYRQGVIPLSDPLKKDARTLARAIAEVRKLLDEDDEAGAQKILDELWADVLAAADTDGPVARADESPLVEMPTTSVERQAWAEKAGALRRDVRQLEQERRFVLAMQMQTRVAWLDFVAARAQHAEMAGLHLENYRKALAKVSAGSPQAEQLRKQLEKMEQDATEVADCRRIALVRAWRNGGPLQVFFADPFHGQSLVELQGRLDNTMTQLRANADRALSAGERKAALDLAGECERIRGLLSAEKLQEAQQALDAQWALVMSAGEAGAASTLGAVETVPLPESWIALATRGVVDTGSPGRDQQFLAFRTFVLECSKSRDAVTGNVPMSSVRSVASRMGRGTLLVFLSYAGDPQLAWQIDKTKDGLQQAGRTPEEQAAMRPFLEALDEIAGLLKSGDQKRAQAVLDARWQDVLRVVDRVYLRPSAEELEATRLAIGDKSWLTPEYSKRVMDRLEEIAKSGGSMRDVARLGVKVDYVSKFQMRQRELQQWRQQLDKDEEEVSRLERLGRPVDARLRERVDLSRANLDHGDTVGLDVFDRGLQCAIRSVSGQPTVRRGAQLMSTGEWFFKRAADPSVARVLRQRIVEIEDALDPPKAGKSRFGQQTARPELTQQHERELREALQEFRALLQDIDGGRLDEAQATMDRMMQGVLSIEP